MQLTCEVVCKKIQLGPRVNFPNNQIFSERDRNTKEFEATCKKLSPSRFTLVTIIWKLVKTLVHPYLSISYQYRSREIVDILPILVEQRPRIDIGISISGSEIVIRVQRSAYAYPIWDPITKRISSRDWCTFANIVDVLIPSYRYHEVPFLAIIMALVASERDHFLLS